MRRALMKSLTCFKDHQKVVSASFFGEISQAIHWRRQISLFWLVGNDGIIRVDYSGLNGHIYYKSDNVMNEAYLGNEPLYEKNSG
jgi:hypothetical protein